MFFLDSFVSLQNASSHLLHVLISKSYIPVYLTYAHYIVTQYNDILIHNYNAGKYGPGLLRR
jgi:hypothetical protein